MKTLIQAIVWNFIGETNWMEDYRRWSSDPAYFAGALTTFSTFSTNIPVALDDEDNNGDSISINTEQKRFNREKDEFQRKYKEQIDQVKKAVRPASLHPLHLSLHSSVTFPLAKKSK